MTPEISCHFLLVLQMTTSGLRSTWKSLAVFFSWEAKFVRAYEGFGGSLMVVLEGGHNKSRKTSSERSDFGNIQMKILTLPFIESFCSFELAGHICVYVYIFDMNLFAIIHYIPQTSSRHPPVTPFQIYTFWKVILPLKVLPNFSQGSVCNLKMLKFGVRINIRAHTGQSTPIREGKINPIMGVYIPIKGGMSLSPIGSLEPCTYPVSYSAYFSICVFVSHGGFMILSFTW